MRTTNRSVSSSTLGRPEDLRNFDPSNLWAMSFRYQASRLQTFRYVQASEFARLSDRSYHCEFPHRAAETFTSGHIVLRCLRTLRICYPSAQAIDGERTFTFQDLQPCRLL